MSTESPTPAVAAIEEPVPRAAWRRELKLLRYAKPHWRGFVGMVGASLAGVGVNLARPWPLKILIDNVIDGKPIPHWLTFLPGADSRHGLLAWVVAAEILIYLAGTIAAMTTQYASLTLGQYMTWSLAGDLFRHLQRLSLLFHTRREAGDLIERVTTDSYSIDTLLTGALLPVIEAVAMLGSVILVMSALDWRLTLLAVSVVPLILIATRVFARPMRERAREQRDSEGRMASVVEQTLGAIPAVQAFTRESRQELRFRQNAQQTVRAYARSALTGMGFQFATGLVLTLGTAAVLYAGGLLALEGAITAGTIVVFVSYVGSLYEPIESLSHTAQTIQSAAAETDRVMEIMEIEPAVADRPGAGDHPVAGSVRYDGVTFGYEADRPVLHEISFAADPG